MIAIRPASDSDFDAVWPIFHAVVKKGDTYAYPPDTDRDGAFKIWMTPPAMPYIACEGDRVVGTYFIKPNQPGQGAHVANAGFMVDPGCQGRGIGRLMGEHAVQEAQRLGFTAMQFNLVVSTNQGAVVLWQKLGFHIVCTLPGAFRHPDQGFVDAYIMYRNLQQI